MDGRQAHWSKFGVAAHLPLGTLGSLALHVHAHPVRKEARMARSAASLASKSCAGVGRGAAGRRRHGRRLC
jgi:hypothetical protein